MPEKSANSNPACHEPNDCCYLTERRSHRRNRRKLERTRGARIAPNLERLAYVSW